MLKNIILDFGNVIYKVDTDAAVKEFAKLSDNPDLIKNCPKSFFTDIIADYESGKIETEQFIKQLKDKFNLQCTAEDITNAWNSILIELYDYAFDCVKELRSRYNIFILSNTSKLHYDNFMPQCKEVFEMFNKTYFSNFVGLRKPDVEAYKFVLEDANLAPEETLFADDLPENLEPFKSLGGLTVCIDEFFTLQDMTDSLVVGNGCC